MASHHHLPSRLTSKSSLCFCKSPLDNERTRLLVLCSLLAWFGCAGDGGWFCSGLLLPGSSFPPFHLHRLAPTFYGEWINHCQDGARWQAYTHIRHPRFTPHIEARAGNLDHRVNFKLVIDLPIPKWIIHWAVLFRDRIYSSATCDEADMRPMIDSCLHAVREQESEVNGE